MQAIEKAADGAAMPLCSMRKRQIRQENRCAGPLGMDTNIPTPAKPDKLV
jgi:hypothetical protein